MKKETVLPDAGRLGYLCSRHAPRLPVSGWGVWLCTILAVGSERRHGATSCKLADKRVSSAGAGCTVKTGNGSGICGAGPTGISGIRRIGLTLPIYPVVFAESPAPCFEFA